MAEDEIIIKKPVGGYGVIVKPPKATVSADVVLDGDTFRSTNQFGDTDFRLFGIDAPESTQGEWGKAAKDFETELVQGRQVRISPAGSSYGRTIGRATLDDGTDIQVEKVKRGLAVPYREFWDDIDTDYADQLDQAEQYAKQNKLGMHGGYADNSHVDTPSQYRQRKKIESGDVNAFKPVGDEVPLKKEGALASVGGALDYLNNVARTGIREAVDAPEGHKLKSAYESMKQAANNERFTSSEMLRDSINMAQGHGRVRFGTDNDDKWTPGDAVDVTFNIAADIATDPLTYMSGGLSLLYKVPAGVIKGLGYGDKVLKAANTVKNLAPAGSALRRSLMASKEASGLFVGGAMGYGSTDNEDSIFQQIAMTAAGMTLGTAAGRNLGKAAVDIPREFAARKVFGQEAGSTLRENADAISQWYVNATGRGVTKELGPDGRALTTHWKEFQDGTTAKNAFEKADKEISVGDDIGDAIVRKKAVQARADEIVNEAKKPLEDFLERESTRIVDSKYRFGDGADEVARREELIGDTAAKIAELRLSGMTVGKAREIEKAGQQVIEEQTRMIISGRFKALEPLTAVERVVANAFMREGKVVFKTNRETLLKEHKFDPDTMLGGGLMKRIKSGELSGDELATLVDTANRDFAKFKADKMEEMGRTNVPVEVMNKELAAMQKRQDQLTSRWQRGYIDPVEETLAYSKLNGAHQAKFNGITSEATNLTKAGWENTALQKLNYKVRDAVEGWKKHNNDVVEEYNKRWRKYDKDGVQISTDMRGVDWHTSDVMSKEMSDSAEELLQVQRVSRAKMARKLESSPAIKVLGEDKAYVVYARELASSFVIESQRRAMSVMSGYRSAVPGTQIARMEKFLRGYDQMTNLAKANMLMFSMSWLKNNYWDNLAKAYVEGGLANLIDAGGMRLYQSQLRKDLKTVASGKFEHRLATPEMEEAVKLGVLEGPAFNALVDQADVKILNSANPALDHYLKNQKQVGPNFVQRTMGLWMTGLQNTMGRLGSYVESSARFVTWQHTRDALLRTPEYAGQTAKASADAANMVKKTFFDYGDVTALETAVFKRMIPFYSFYSKNIPYWTGALTDPKRVGRIAGLQSARDAVGNPLSDRERDETAPYLLENYARKVSTDADGTSTYVISPSFSMDDAVRWLTNPEESLLGKSQPFLRTIYEWATGDDTFAGGKVAPSDIGRREDGTIDEDKAKKFLYSRGFKFIALQAIGEKLGFPADSMKVYVDAKGNPYTTSDTLVWADKILSTVFPHGFIDQLAGSIGKVGYDKESIGKAIFNRLAPLQQIDVSSKQKTFHRKNAQEKRGN